MVSKRVIFAFVLSFFIMLPHLAFSQNTAMLISKVHVDRIAQLIDGLPAEYKGNSGRGWIGFIALDIYYRATTLPEMVRFMRPAVQAANRLRWSGEAGDCDSASIVFMAEMTKIATRIGENSFPIGLVKMTDDYRSFMHNMIWFVDDTMELWFIEPRGGTITHWLSMPGLRVFWFLG